MSFRAGDSDRMRMMTTDHDLEMVRQREAGIEAKAARLQDLVRHRDRHFRRAVLADSAMAIMLSLFQAELQSVELTQQNLVLVNLLDPTEAASIIDDLTHAGLVVATGENPERRTVGLSALGSARMRSYVSDFPDA